MTNGRLRGRKQEGEKTELVNMRNIKRGNSKRSKRWMIKREETREVKKRVNEGGGSSKNGRQRQCF